MPVVLLKNATKSLQEGFQAARQRLSIGSAGSDRGEKQRVSFGSSGKSSSFTNRSEKGRKSKSFDESSMMAQMHSSFPTLGFPNPIAEFSREFELEEETSQEFNAAANSPSTSPSKVRFPAMFRKKRSDVSDLTMDETPSRMSSFLDSPRKISFRRGKKGSDISNDSSDDARNEAPIPDIFRPGTKRSEMSVDATVDSSPPVNPNDEGRHSRIPGVLRMSLAALKRNPDRNNSKHGSG
jgi:hypothetical protein